MHSQEEAERFSTLDVAIEYRSNLPNHFGAMRNYMAHEAASNGCGDSGARSNEIRCFGPFAGTVGLEDAGPWSPEDIYPGKIG